MHSTTTTRPSFSGRHSGIVDIGPYLGRPPEPLLVPPPAPRANTSHAATILAALALVVASAALALAATREPPLAPATLEPRATPVKPDPSTPPPIEDEALGPGPSAAGETPAAPRAPVRRSAPSEEPIASSGPGPEEAASLDQLMDRAVTPAVPAAPSRTEVASVLRGLGGRVSQCAEQDMRGTVVSTHVVIDGATGRVARAVVEGDVQWTPAGACIARALETARFSPFARDRFEVEFPYRL